MSFVILCFIIFGFLFSLGCCCGCTRCLDCSDEEILALSVDVTIAGVTGTPVCVFGTTSCGSALNHTFHLPTTVACQWSEVGPVIPDCFAFFTAATITLIISCLPNGKRSVGAHVGSSQSTGYSGDGLYEAIVDGPLGCAFGPIVLPYVSSTYFGTCNFAGATVTAEGV